MTELSTTILVPLASGVLLLLIEYFVIVPLRSRVNTGTPDEQKKQQLEQNNLTVQTSQQNWLFSNGSFFVSLRVFLIIVMITAGSIILARLNYDLIVTTQRKKNKGLSKR